MAGNGVYCLRGRYGRTIKKDAEFCQDAKRINLKDLFLLGQACIKNLDKTMASCVVHNESLIRIFRKCILEVCTIKLKDFTFLIVKCFQVPVLAKCTK